MCMHMEKPHGLRRTQPTSYSSLTMLFFNSPGRIVRIVHTGATLASLSLDSADRWAS